MVLGADDWSFEWERVKLSVWDLSFVILPSSSSIIAFNTTHIVFYNSLV